MESPYYLQVENLNKMDKFKYYKIKYRWNVDRHFSWIHKHFLLLFQQVLYCLSIRIHVERNCPFI